MKVAQCPECKAWVVECDNAVRLDHPAVEYNEVTAPWTIIRFSIMGFASVGDASLDGKGHVLHEHQPEESVMR
jgi:hypothetical protein